MTRLAVAAVIAAASAAGPQEAGRFVSKVEAVRVDVLVVESGRPVRGLKAEDFEILDEGVPQQVDLVSFEQLPLNAILVFDVSASVAGDRLEHLRAAGGALLDELRPEDQAAVVTFSHVLTLGSGLTHDVTRVRMSLDAVRASGETALLDGTYAGIMLAEADIGRALLLVFSDGVDTASWLTSEAVLETAKQSDAVVYGVTVRGGGTPRFLRDVSAFTGGSLFEIESTKDLKALFPRILEEFRQRYLVSYSPQGVSKTGWHRLEVHVKNHRATIKARPGYLAGVK